MRKAYTLVEMLTVLGVAVVFFVAIDISYRTILVDIPSAYRITQANTSVLNALHQLRRDLYFAKDLPNSFNSYTANDANLLIEQPDNMILYQLKDGQISRQELLNKEKTSADEAVSWAVPHAKIHWRPLRQNNKTYAVEITSYIEQASGDHIQKKFANSYLYFTGLYKKALE